MIELLKKISHAFPVFCHWSTSTASEQPATQGHVMPLKSRLLSIRSPVRPQTCTSGREPMILRHPRVYQQSGHRSTASSLAALAAIMTMLVPGAATAQSIQNPPLLPQEITVFPERDFTSISGFAPNADLLVELIRQNGVVSNAMGRTDATGALEVNHPGGVCWNNITPDIGPADVVRVTYPANGNYQTLVPTPLALSGAATYTQNVTATQAAVVQAGTPTVPTYTVVVKGRAQLANGDRIPLDRLEVRIINPEFIGGLGSRITRRDIRADSIGGRVAGPPLASGTLAYDLPTSSSSQPLTFTAVFTDLNPDERLLAIEGQTRVMGWQETTAAGDRLGMTIYEVGELGGPGIGGCAPGPNGVVASKNPTAPVFYNPANLLDAANSLNLSSLKDVTVFPERDFVSIDKFPVGTDLQVVVRRGSSSAPVVGTARGTVGRSGVFEVNHPGGVCWSGQTPDIVPGDWIDVFTVVNGSFSFGQKQQVIYTTIKKSAYINNGVVKVEGFSLTAPDANSKQTAFPLRLTEQRIINPDFTTTRIGRRDIRADVNGGRVGNITGVTGTLTAKGNGEWEAVYRGLLPNEQQLAVAGQSRAMAWHSADVTGNRFGMTIFEFGEVGGPGISGCPATGSASIAITP